MNGIENSMCPECYKESKKNELLKNVEKYNLPELTGNENKRHYPGSSFKKKVEYQKVQ